MSDNNIIPQALVEYVNREDYGVDGPVFVFTANTAEGGLASHTVDVRAQIPNAFPPRQTDPRFVTDKVSFLAETKRRPLLPGLSTVWGNRNKGQVVVIYDELGGDATADYTRRSDQLTLQFVQSPDWATLLAVVNAKFYDQEDFGARLETVGHLVTSHDFAELLEIVDTIRGSKSGKFESRVQRATSTQSITFTEEVKASAGTATKSLEVPKEIEFAARPFEDYPLVSVKCWLRLSVQQGDLRLALVPQPFDHVIREAWRTVTEDLAEELGVPVYAANL